MQSTQERQIRITAAELEHLERVIEARLGVSRRDEAHLEALREELAQAEIVDSSEIAPDVVTMRSRVRIRDVANGEESVYTLVFPREADIAEGRLSVLAPLGTAILGYRQGDVFEWPVPGGMRTLDIVQLLYQPEAAAAAQGRASLSASRGGGMRHAAEHER
jgi:regulator of nucleoside diphosphate kinase